MSLSHLRIPHVVFHSCSPTHTRIEFYREEFLKDEEAYMRKYGLTEPQAAAIRAKNVLQLIAAGGNAYYLAKFAGIFHLDMQDIGAQQTGVTKEEFKAKLVAAGK